MKIAVITGSARKNGTSALLADQFIKGAKKAGHEIYRFDAAFSDVHPCIGCDQCKCGVTECVIKDDMLMLYPKLIEADVIVYATPLYYHGMSAQIKTVIDRFHGIDNFLCGAEKKAVLLVTGGNPSAWVMDGIVAMYETDLRYLQWKDAGKVLALGCNTRADIENTSYPEQACQLGFNLKE